MNEKSEECCPGGCCEPTGLSSKTKAAICLAVLLAASAVLANRIHKRADEKPSTEKKGFATDLSALKKTETSDFETVEQPAEKKDTEITSLDDLNKVAADEQAVFVVLPVGNSDKMPDIRTSVAAAAARIAAQGTRIKVFTLEENCPEYLDAITRVSAPCVLAMVQGGTMQTVEKDITDKSLMEAFITASRPPSGCGPNGCGPGGCE